MSAFPAPDALRADTAPAPGRRIRPEPATRWPAAPAMVRECTAPTQVTDTTATPGALSQPPALSVVVPAYNEAGNLPVLVREIVAALRGRVLFEIVVVDDASDDDGVEELAAVAGEVPELRVLRHAHRSGQSAALWTGARAAHAGWIATLDGDGQNDPADIPRLLRALDAAPASVRMVCGWRVARRDAAGKRWASRAANAIRRALLHDDTPDTGCGIKLFDRALFLQLPNFDHMHRYLPALAQRAGAATLSVPVNHRPRTRGASKYGNLERAWVGIADLAGVAWLLRRNRQTPVQELRGARG